MMKLTRTEKDILLHRLAVPDAIDDALTDCDNPKFSHELVEYGIGWIEERIKDDLPFEGMTDVEKAVLEDCVDGSTWVASLYERGNPTPEYKRAKAAARRLEKKISEVLGKPVSLPVS